MKKLLIVLLAMVTLGAAQSSSGLAFAQGDHAIGIGANVNWGDGFGAAVAWDMGAFHNMFSIGAEVNTYFDVDKQKWNNGSYSSEWKWTYTNVSPQFRFGFHPFGLDVLQGKIPVADQLNPYIVGHVGPTLWWSKDTYKDETGKEIENSTNGVDFDAWGVALGIRWFFKPNFSVWGEVDWDRFIGGVAFKF